MKFTVIIPARISSTRFPGKILHDIKGLPMIEHVRRRALLGKNVNEVFVATCDQEIKSVVQKSGGKVLMTSNTHKNGTQRASEAAKKIKSDYVILLQGDEPCILPRTIDDLIQKIQKDKGEFTITSSEMTRFTLTKKQACNFILNCCSNSQGGEIFVPKIRN